MKIMIVDDNAGMREMIRDIVCRTSDEVVECSDGGTAVTEFGRFRPDTVLMDIEMKGMDGFTAAGHITNIDPAARIIFVTSHNTSAFRTKAKLLHVTGFVCKDRLSDLLTLLERTPSSTPSSEEERS